MRAAEPTIAMPRPGPEAPSRPRLVQPRDKRLRYLPERGLVQRLSIARSNGAVTEFITRHGFGGDSGATFGAELVKAGVPPLSEAGVATALDRFLSFKPLNVDALRPFVFLTTERSLRAEALSRVGGAMRRAGRSVRLMSDAADSQSHDVLISAGKRLGCGVTAYEGSPHCVELLRQTDLGCLNLIEAGFRAPLDKVSLLRLSTLVQVTNAEPVLVIRPKDADAAISLATIGLKRVILAIDETDAPLGPVLSALRQADLALAEIIDLRTDGLRPASPASLASLLI